METAGQTGGDTRPGVAHLLELTGRRRRSVAARIDERGVDESRREIPPEHSQVAS